jgi:hypothetical protein
MNTFHDLLQNYATRSGLRVDAREWLMLLELDPRTAATAMTQLAILAAEDLTVTLTEQAAAAITTAALRTDTRAEAGLDAAAAWADLTAFTRRIETARMRAWTIWTDTVVPLLTAACVLLEAPAVTVRRPPHRSAAGWVRLPGVGSGYPAQVAVRRRHTGYPVVRFDLDTCRRIAADITTARNTDPNQHGPAHLLPAAVLIDGDQPVLTVGADTTERAWRTGAAVLLPDTDGRYALGSRHWPWQLDVSAASFDQPGPAATASPRHRSTRRRSGQTARLTDAGYAGEMAAV